MVGGGKLKAYALPEDRKSVEKHLAGCFHCGHERELHKGGRGCCRAPNFNIHGNGLSIGGCDCSRWKGRTLYDHGYFDEYLEKLERGTPSERGIARDYRAFRDWGDRMRKRFPDLVKKP